MARAAALGLPAPVSQAAALHGFCAAELSSTAEECFPRAQQARAWIRGVSEAVFDSQTANAKVASTTGHLSYAPRVGGGGTGLSSTGHEFGWVCAVSGCGGGTTYLYSPILGLCTHSYAANQNDYYWNGKAGFTFNYFQLEPFVSGAHTQPGDGNLNCHRVELWSQPGQVSPQFGCTVSFSHTVCYTGARWGSLTIHNS